MIEWYYGYKNRRAEKAKIKEELFTHCLAPQSCDVLVYVRKRKEAREVTAVFKNI